MAQQYVIMAHVSSAYYVTDSENNEIHKPGPSSCRVSGFGGGDLHREQLFYSSQQPRQWEGGSAQSETQRPYHMDST